VAAEAMTIAWRRLADVPLDDPRPWLFATARNLVYAEHRVASRYGDVSREELDEIPGQAQPPTEPDTIDSGVAGALTALSPLDREALLLVAWEDLTPSLAAASLGITAVAFRVRFHRARRRFEHALAKSNSPAEIGVARMESP
jgi:RNA polymerase sigma-70 factor (ECF subfamily)